jgi:hypothetical protein
MHRDGVAGSGHSAVAFVHVGDLQIGRRFAAREVDLRLLVRHPANATEGVRQRRRRGP